MPEAKPKFDGVTVKLAGGTYVVPPLSFKNWTAQEPLIRDFWKVREKVLEKNDDKALIDNPFITKYVPIVQAAISQNYPELPAGYFADALTLKDIPQFSNALAAALVDDQEESAPGEARAAAR